MEELHEKIKSLVREREDLEAVIHVDTDQTDIECERFLCTTVEKIIALAAESNLAHTYHKGKLTLYK